MIQVQAKKVIKVDGETRKELPKDIRHAVNKFFSDMLDDVVENKCKEGYFGQDKYGLSEQLDVKGEYEKKEVFIEGDLYEIEGDDWDREYECYNLYSLHVADLKIHVFDFNVDDEVAEVRYEIEEATWY